MISRRDYMKGAALLTVGGMAGLAGCSSGKAADTGKARVPIEPDYKSWFDGVSNYDRTIDMRGQDQVAIQVGAEGNMGAFAFGPAAVAISPGTTVTWEWTGKGGGHNVVAESGSFDSGELVTTSGHIFEHTFADPGIYKYVCEPHRTMGIRGVVFVALGVPGS